MGRYEIRGSFRRVEGLDRSSQRSGEKRVWEPRGRVGCRVGGPRIKRHAWDNGDGVGKLGGRPNYFAKAEEAQVRMLVCLLAAPGDQWGTPHTP